MTVAQAIQKPTATMQLPWIALWSIGKEITGWLLRRKKRICLLVVEDNPTDAELTEAKIQRLGWECDIVSSAEAAYPLLIAKRHSVVLLDLRLPYESGTHVAGRMLKVCPDAHIVLVAGEPTDISGAMCGAYFGLIIKPVTPEALKDIFRKPRV